MEQKKTAYAQDLKGYRAMAVDLMGNIPIEVAGQAPNGAAGEPV